MEAEKEYLYLNDLEMCFKNLKKIWTAKVGKILNNQKDKQEIIRKV